MPPRSVSLALCCLALMAGMGSPLPAQAGAVMADVIQVVADLTLIDGACRDSVVDFGIVFRFATGRGVQPVDLMPMGARRTEFEAALRNRRASFNTDELCGEIAANYAEALPGSVSLPTASGQR